MSEHDSSPRLANTMQDPDTGDSQAQTQTGSQDTSTEQQPESQRINGLMSTLGRRTNERDAAVRERDQLMAERDQAQQALDAMVRQYVAQPTQQEVLDAYDTEQAPAPPPPRTATLDSEGEFRDEQGQVLMTQAQWAETNRFAPVTPARVSNARTDSKKSDLDALDRAIAQHMR